MNQVLQQIQAELQRGTPIGAESPAPAAVAARLKRVLPGRRSASNRLNS